MRIINGIKIQKCEHFIGIFLIREDAYKWVKFLNSQLSQIVKFRMKFICFTFAFFIVAGLTAKGNGQLCEQIRVPYCANLADFHSYTTESRIFRNSSLKVRIAI